MAGKVVIAGIVIAALGPLAFLALALFSGLMPGCVIGGSGGPAYGCSVWGVSFDWLINWATPIFVISFFTVPTGVLIVFAGLVALVVKSFRSHTQQGPKP